LSDLEFDEYEIVQALDQLNVYKSPGPDGLHPKVLYETKNVIASPRKIIFEASVHTNQLPSDWTAANISVIHKKGKIRIMKLLSNQFNMHTSYVNLWKGLLEITV